MATDDFKLAEAAAPLDASGPLPLEVASLQFIPADKRDRYARQLSGAFKLAWIPGDDPHAATYMDAIASGQLRLLPAGETDASLKAAEVASAEVRRQFEAEMAAAEKRDDDANKAAIKAHADRQAARAQAELDRVRASYGRR